MAAPREHAEPEWPEREPASEPAPAAGPAPPSRVPPALASYAIAAGNAHTAALAARVLHRQPVVAAGPLTESQVTDAIAWTNARFDELSIRSIQEIVGGKVTGTFDEVSARAVATFQQNHHILVDGKVGHQTLTTAFPARVAADGHDQLIHVVADLENIDITTETIAVHFDSTLAQRSASSFESSGLRVIRLGATAFASSRMLAAVVRAESIATEAPEAPEAGPAPAILDPFDAGFRLLLNQSRLDQPHSVRAIQGLIGAPREDAWSVDLVQRIAEWQEANGLPGDGEVDQETLEVMVAGLKAASDNNGAIRLIVDFFDFDDAGNLITIYFDANEDANAETLPPDPNRPNQPASIQIGPAGMAKDFPGLVHTIEHEFVHVRLMREGETDLPTHEFLAEATEMTSPLTPEEDFSGFFSDARRGLENWNLMPAERQVRHRERFIEVRRRVHERFDDVPAAERPNFQATVDGYDAVVVPPAAGP